MTDKIVLINRKSRLNGLILIHLHDSQNLMIISKNIANTEIIKIEKFPFLVPEYCPSGCLLNLLLIRTISNLLSPPALKVIHLQTLIILLH